MLLLYCVLDLKVTGLLIFPFFWQNVPPAVLVRFLREHRSEWADFNVDAYSAASLKAGSYAYPGMRPTRFTGSQIIMPLGHTIEHEEVCLLNCLLFLSGTPIVWWNLTVLSAAHIKCMFYSIIVTRCSILIISSSEIFSCLKLFDLRGILLHKKMLLCQETFIYCRCFLCLVAM